MIDPTELDRVSLDGPDEWGNSPLSMALVAERFDEAARLLASGASRDRFDALGQGLWHFAAASGNTAYLAYLVARGISVDVANSRGETPLMIAVLYERAQSVKYLLSRGANPDRKNAKGISVREIARARRSAAINRMLAEALR